MDVFEWTFDVDYHINYLYMTLEEALDRVPVVMRNDVREEYLSWQTKEGSLYWRRKMEEEKKKTS